MEFVIKCALNGSMPLTSKKFEEHIASGAFVRPFVTLFDA